jgi:hypothetical protein
LRENVTQQRSFPATSDLPQFRAYPALQQRKWVLPVRRCAIRPFCRSMTLAFMAILLSGCWLRISDPMSYTGLQAFAPGRSADDVAQVLDEMLTSLGAERFRNDRSVHQLDKEYINIKTDDRPLGGWICVESLGRLGTTQVEPAVAELFAQLRMEMEKEFGEEFVARASCAGEEPYWPGGDGA